MAKMQVTEAEQVQIKPPWDREEIYWKDIPAVIKHELGLTYKPLTVYHWIKNGLPDRANPGTRIYLIARKHLNRLFVRRKDLDAFVSAA